MSGISSVLIKVGAETAQAVSELRKVDGALKDTATTGQKFQSAVGKAAIPAAAALTALGGAAIVAAKAAAQAQASREQLDSQLRRSVGATEDAVKANEDWVSSMSSAVAISAGELRPALAGLVRATGDVSEAHNLMRLALDTAAATGKPLSSVTAALAKAYNGSASSLKRLVPSISDAAIKSGDWAKIQKQLNEQVEGAAKGEAETAAGQYRKLGMSMKALQVTIGTALLPAIQALLPLVTQIFQLATSHSDVFLVVAAAVAAFAAAILVLNAAIGAYNTLATAGAAIQKLWNSEQLASAIATVRNTVALIAQKAAMLATRVATIAFTVAQAALNVVLTANPIGIVVVALAALAAGLYLAYRHSATFRSIVQSAFQAAKDNVILLLGPMGLMIRAFQLLWQNSSTARQIITSSLNAILEAIQPVVDAIENLVSWLGRIHFPSKPSWLPLSLPGTSSMMVPAGRSGSAAPVINVTIHGAIDPEATAIAIRRVLERYDRRRGGPLGLGAPRAV